MLARDRSFQTQDQPEDILDRGPRIEVIIVPKHVHVDISIARMPVGRYERLVIGADCSISSHTVIGPYTVIGNNCHLGNNVTINNSILWDDITVENDVTLSNCILGYKTLVEEGVRLFEKIKAVRSGSIVTINKS